MLGSDLGKVFYDLSPYLLDRDELDITNERGVSSLFRNLKPDVVINAAAYTDVDGCETNREIAKKINGDAPGYLAKASRDAGAVFVHYSTDYVFSGQKKAGYSEEDEPGPPINFYGESKLMGENVVKEIGGDHYLVRTSWLFGLKGKNFVETILRLAQGKEKLRVVNDQHGKPTFSLDLAKKTRELVESREKFGIYHITNELITTWYDFAKEILKRRDGERGPSFAGISSCASSEFPRPAKRPRYSILLNTKLSPMRIWQEALQEYLTSRDIYVKM